MIAGGDAARRAGVLILVVVCLFSLAHPGRALAQGGCAPDATRLCLNGNRFQAEVAWTVPGLGSGEGHAVPLTADTGSFWFFSNSNLELIVKVLDGRAVNRHFWVFYGGLSDVEYTLTVTDTATGTRETYTNTAHRLASAADVSAFDAEAPPAARAGTRQEAVSTAEAPLRTGPEFQVNVTAAGNQSQPAVAAVPDGSFMVVWTGDTFPLQRDDQEDVYGRLYDSAGNPRGGEFRLNETLPGTQSEPRVAVNSAGEFMVVWDDSGKGAQARLFGADGSPLTGEITLARGPNLQLHPDVATDPAGGFLVVWNEISAVPALLINQIHAQRFDAHGGPIGSLASFSAMHLVLSLRVTGSPRGGYLVSWAQAQIAVDVAASDILAQRLDAAGQAMGGEIAVSEPFGAGGFSSVTPVSYADGGFSVLWTSSPNFLGGGFDGLYGRRYAADGSAGAVAAFRAGFGVGSWAPAAVPLASGDTWVLWYGGGTLQHRDSGLSSGVFDPSWTLVSDVSQVNTYSAGEQVEPAVAASPGGIVAVWTSGSALGVDLPIGSPDGTQDGSGFGIFAQRFTAATCALSSGELCLGGRFRVAVQFTDPRSGTAGTGQAIPLTSDTGAFWFFDPANVELILKVLDGRAVNGHFWVFSGALSDVAYTITVTDTQTGQTRVYHNAPHQLASRADVDAF